MGKCKFLGEEKGAVLCDSCGGKVTLKVFDCAVFGKCTIGKRAAEVPGCCNGCPEYRDSETGLPAVRVANQARFPSKKGLHVGTSGPPQIWTQGGKLVVNGAGQVRVCDHCPCVALCCACLNNLGCTPLGSSSFCSTGYVIVSYTNGGMAQTIPQDLQGNGTIIGAFPCGEGDMNISVSSCDTTVYTIGLSGLGWSATAKGAATGDSTCSLMTINTSDITITSNNGSCLPFTASFTNLQIVFSCTDVVTYGCPGRKLPLNMPYSFGTGTGDLASLSGLTGTMTWFAPWGLLLPFTSCGSTQILFQLNPASNDLGIIPLPWSVTTELIGNPSCSVVISDANSGGTCTPFLQTFSIDISSSGCCTGTIDLTVSAP